MPVKTLCGTFRIPPNASIYRVAKMKYTIENDYLKRENLSCVSCIDFYLILLEIDEWLMERVE